MTRGVSLYLVGSLVLVGLVGCGRGFIKPRESWRHEAEVACLKSGTVKESPTVALMKPIDGPGMCGADFPLKVAALGEPSAIGYADELRPPGSIPNASALPRPITSPSPAPIYRAPTFQSQPTSPQAYPSQPVSSQPIVAPPQSAAPTYEPMPGSPGAPLSLTPPGIAPVEPEPAYPVPPQNAYVPRGPVRADPQYPPARPTYGTLQPRSAPLTRPAQELPRLGPVRAPVSSPITTASVQPSATLACPMVSALDQWVAAAVQPAAVKWFGQPVTEIRQISAYSCRGMNGNPNARISEHAFGNALDIAGFTLADGRKITVKNGWRGPPEEQGFLHDVQLAACQQFTTVLAPGSNIYHYDHIHVDLMRRSSGRRICQPAAEPGEVVAARAAQRYAKRSDPNVTGSIKPTKQKGSWLGYSNESQDPKLPFAVPGEDGQDD